MRQEKADKEVSRLNEALIDPRPETRWDAAVKLGKLGPRARPALPRLRHVASQDQDSLVRDAAQESLAAVDTERTPAARPEQTPGASGRPPASGGPPVPGARRSEERGARQIVGCGCVLCGGQIGSTQEGRFCGGCGNPIHNACAPHQPPGWSEGKCGTCGGDLPTAPATDSGVEQFTPNPGLAVALVALGVILFCIVLVFLILCRGHPGGLGGALAVLLVSLGAWLVRRGERAAGQRVETVLQRDARAPILLLRSFSDDEVLLPSSNGVPFRPRREISFEEVLAGAFSPFGPVIAIGRPGETLPPLGFARFWVPDDSWKGRVAQLLDQCQRVVIVLGRSSGLAWEVDQLFQRNVPQKVVLLMPPTDDGQARTRWETARRMFRDVLPPYEGDEVAVTFGASWECRVERRGPLSPYFARNGTGYRGFVNQVMGQAAPPSRGGRGRPASPQISRSPSQIIRLIQNLGDDKPHIRWDAARQLGLVGREAKGAVPALMELLHDSDGAVRRMASEALQSIAPEAGAEARELNRG